MDDFVLESPLLKLPLEALKTSLKQQQKLVERDTAWLTQQAAEPCTPATLDKMVTRLEQLKQKLVDMKQEDGARIAQSRARLAHLEQPPDVLASQRLDRLVADYMLRRGCLQGSTHYAQRHNVTPLIDADVFARVAEVASALRGGHAAACLSWCNDHKTTLRKRGSTLEFSLRRQEFVELCRVGAYAQAIEYARKHFPPHRSVHGSQINAVCALLCHRPDTTLEPYRTLYAADQWHVLAALFVQTHHDLYNIPVHAPLEIALSSGMAALKTPACAEALKHHKTQPLTLDTWLVDAGQAQGNPKTNTRHVCPICSPELLQLSASVPIAKAARSHLVDVLDPEGVLEGENVPVVLPSGRLYGLQSLRAYCTRHGIAADKVVDPATGETFDAATVRKAFVL
ncbi:CTLH/CRA C-terminal to lish motif domain-domain-containing protein [Protomyces lactucae-debilis]|uniref:CTLH/CRA C-terminal to lish motif domain-domain-containing protein n=1 Tax=Protomyces lactucae-debilis TaxID=2754530 RepID=A0A1Y2F802_PROLT|nr:CTLH/CRA C-terminal to lish motif domain-containing protein [Protomyces lactucae-debilis]ORY80021.1 CTLH/CRA C-terminal to lish motif domain-domain-containing protein [Protomyces lactucae-debilis]